MNFVAPRNSLILADLEMSQSNKGHLGQPMSVSLFFEPKFQAVLCSGFCFFALPKFKFWSNRE
jgi:hypothetical protein